MGEVMEVSEPAVSVIGFKNWANAFISIFQHQTMHIESIVHNSIAMSS
jgi:hypothetical protein